MTQETEREAFEKAAKLEGLNVARHRIGHDDYDCDNTQWRWLGFKHGLMQARARLGKGEVDRAFDDGARFAIAMKSTKPVEVGELVEYLCCNTNLFSNDIEEAAQAILKKYNVTEKL